MVFKNCPGRDEMPLAHKFICGNQIPAPPPMSRPEWNGVHKGWPHYSLPLLTCGGAVILNPDSRDEESLVR